MAEETPLEKAIRLAKEKSNVPVKSAQVGDVREMSYEDYMASKKKLPTVSPLVSGSGSKTSGRPLSTSQPKFNPANPFGGQSVAEYIGPERVDEIENQMGDNNGFRQVTPTGSQKPATFYMQGKEVPIVNTHSSYGNLPVHMLQEIPKSIYGTAQHLFDYAKNEISNGIEKSQDEKQLSLQERIAQNSEVGNNLENLKHILAEDKNVDDKSNLAMQFLDKIRNVIPEISGVMSGLFPSISNANGSGSQQIKKDFISSLSKKQKEEAIATLDGLTQGLQGRIDMMDKYQKENPVPENILTSTAKTISGMLPDLAIAGLGTAGAEGVATKYIAGLTKDAPAIVAKLAPKAVGLLERSVKAPFTKVLAAKGALEGGASNKVDPTFGLIEGGAKGFGEGMYMHVLGEGANVVSPFIAKVIGKTGATSDISTAIANPLANAGVFAGAKALRTPIEEGRMATAEELANEGAMGIGFSLLHVGQQLKSHQEANKFYDNVLRTDVQTSLGKTINETPEALKESYIPNADIDKLEQARDEIKKAILKEPDLAQKKQLGQEAINIQNQLDASSGVNGIVENKQGVINMINELPELSPEQKMAYTSRVEEIARDFEPVKIAKEKLAQQIEDATLLSEQHADIAKSSTNIIDKVENEVKAKKAKEVADLATKDLTKLIEDELNPPEIKPVEEVKVEEEVVVPIKEEVVAETAEPIANEKPVQVDTPSADVEAEVVDSSPKNETIEYTLRSGKPAKFTKAELELVEDDEIRHIPAEGDVNTVRLKSNDGNDIGRISFRKNDNGTASAIYASLGSPSLYKKGLGKMLYEETAKFVKNEYGLDLVSGFELHGATEKMWKSLVREGKAEVIGQEGTDREGYAYKYTGDTKQSVPAKASRVKQEPLNQRSIEDISKNIGRKDVVSKKAIEKVFSENPDISKVGTEEEYQQHLESIFPNSKLKGEFYHGSDKNFDKFDSSHLGKSSSDKGYFGQGIYFTINPDNTESYGKNQYSAIINSEKPFTRSKENFDALRDKLKDSEIPQALFDAQDLYRMTQYQGEKYSDDITKALKDLGYDSSISSSQVVVFDPENIHIIGNPSDLESFRKFKADNDSKSQSAAETIKGTVLDLPKDISDAGYEVGVVKVGDKYYAVEKQSKKNVSKGFDTEQEVVEAFEANKGKLTVDAMEQATGIKPKVVESKSDALVKETAPKKEMTASEKIRSLKSEKGKVYDGILGLPVAIWDGALETVATAIDAGKAIHQAIKEAVAYIKSKHPDVNDQEVQDEITKQLEDAGVILKGTDVENPVPDVIEEAEKSAEDIAAEEIVEFKKRLSKAMKQAQVSTLIKTGVVQGTLAVDAIKKIGEIIDHKSMLSAVRAVKKVFNNIVKNAYISQIVQAKKGVLTRLKGSKLGKTELMKKYLAINEKLLDLKDLEAYNALTRKLNDQYNARMEGVVADSEIQKFVDRIADKKAKQILDEQIADVDTEVTEEDGQEKVSARRKQLNAAVEINRQSLRKSGYNEKFKPVVKALMNIDTQNLSNREMVDLNMALINVAVNDRLVGHEKVFREYVGQEGNKVLKVKTGDKIKGLVDNMLGADARSLDVNSKIIFKGVKDAAEFQELSGIHGISTANSQVQNIDMKAIEKAYNGLIETLKFKDFNTSENRFLRSLYSIPTQFGSIKNEQKDFARFKSLIKQSAEVLQASKKPTEQREGDMRMEQYQEYLEPFEERSEFESNYVKKQPENAKVVDFFRKQFDEKYEAFSTNSQIYAGRNIGKENFYTPIKYKSHSETEAVEDKASEDIVAPTFTFDPETGDVSERQSSTSINRTNNTTIKANGRVLDMDFDRVMFQKYREMNYDIRSLKYRHQYNAIKSEPSFNDITGSANNSKVLTKSVLKMVQRTMGQGVSNDAIDKAVRGLAPLRAKSVRQALFGVLQVAKQWPSVALRTAINLNTDIDLFHKSLMKVGLNNPIFDQNGIGLRESTRGGTHMELNLNDIASADFSSSPVKLAHQINAVAKRVADYLAKPLTLSDNAVAKQSWAAYYMKHIRDNGGDVNAIDWKNEHLNQNNEAASYADLMVSTTQNVNDNSKQAALLYDDGNAKTLIRDVIAPYSSFARNSQANFEADLRTFSGGTVTEKKAAAVGILSYVAEQTAFNTIKALIGVYVVKAAANSLLSAFGQDEEKNPKEIADKVLKNTTTDLLFGGLGSMANSFGIRGLNKANKAITGDDKDLFYQYNPAQFGEPDFSLAGVYGGIFQNLYSIGQKADYLDGTLTDTFESRGKKYKATTELTGKQQAMATTLFFMDVLSLIGLSEAEVSRINQTAFRSLKKNTTPVKKFQIEYANKKGGAVREEVGSETKPKQQDGFR